MARVIVSPYAIADQDDILRYLHREAGLRTVEKYDAAFRAHGAPVMHIKTLKEQDF
jgi:plasmid stabilization system protein ParE